MGRAIKVWTVILSVTMTVCFASVSVEKQQKILKEYVIYLNSLPSQVYKYEAGEMLKANGPEDIPNAYNVEMKIKATDLHNLHISRYILCFATVTLANHTKIEVQSSQCNYVSDELHNTSEQAGLTNTYTNYNPMVDDNGVEVNTEVTSKQLSAASARIDVLCEGCSGPLNLRSPAVRDLTRLALNDLATHDPYTEHYLNDVLEVDHKIFDRSRYILILNVTSDNCSTSPSQFCKNVKICRVSILESIVTEIANDSKYRNIASNNCTRNTDLPYVNDFDSRVTDTTVPFHKTPNIFNNIYLDNDDINDVQSHQRNPEEPHVKCLAQKSLTKYLQSVKNTQPHEILKIENVTTQVSSGLTTRMVFTATASGTQYLKYKLHCQSIVWEQFSISREHIKVDCQVVHPNSRSRRSVLIHDTPPNADNKALANKLLKKFLKGRKIKATYKVLEINRHTKIMYPKYTFTSLDFKAIPEKANSNLICNAVIKEHHGGHNVTYISCYETGEPNLPVEDDPSALRFQDLMDASLEQYLKTHNIKESYTVLDRLIATEQLLKTKHKSILVKVVFRAIPKISQQPQLLCRSEILGEDLLRKNYKIIVTCVKLGKKKGEIIHQDLNKPHFKLLAKKSLKRYLKSHSIEQPHHVTDLIIVTKQVTNSETITNIDFRAHADTDLVSSHLLCHSEIKILKLQQTINVDCYLVETSITSGNSILVDTKTKPSQGKDYQPLAQKCLDRYLLNHRIEQKYLVSKIVKVDEKKLRISRHVTMDFRGSPIKKKAKDLLCHSNIVIYYSPKKTVIDVTCQNVHHNRAFVSPVIDEDPNKPPIPHLTNEALKVYLKNNNVKEKYVVAERMIATSVLTIMFKEPVVTVGFYAVPTGENKLIALICRAEIVNTKVLFAKTRCMVVGKGCGLTVYEDTGKPLFKKLAEKSLKIYLQAHKTDRDAYVANVLIVTVQIRTSKTTIIYFRAIFKDKPKPFMTIDPHLLCYTVIAEEQGKTRTEVVCTYVIYDSTKGSTSFRQFAPIGGQVVKNPNEAKYKRLAELSLRNYKNIKDIHQYYVSKMLKVTEQTVSGTLTRIEFIATSVEGVVPARLHCKSKIWEQAWSKKLDINVTCKHLFTKNKGVRSISQIRDE